MGGGKPPKSKQSKEESKEATAVIVGIESLKAKSHRNKQWQLLQEHDSDGLHRRETLITLSHCSPWYIQVGSNFFAQRLLTTLSHPGCLVLSLPLAVPGHSK